MIYYSYRYIALVYQNGSNKPLYHRLYRVPGFLFSRPNWVPPLPRPQASIAPLPLGVQVGGHTRSRGRGWGDPIPTKGQTLWYFMILYYNPSTACLSMDQMVEQHQSLETLMTWKGQKLICVFWTLLAKEAKKSSKEKKGKVRRKRALSNKLNITSSMEVHEFSRVQYSIGKLFLIHEFATRSLQNFQKK